MKGGTVAAVKHTSALFVVDGHVKSTLKSERLQRTSLAGAVSHLIRISRLLALRRLRMFLGLDHPVIETQVVAELSHFNATEVDPLNSVDRKSVV